MAVSSPHRRRSPRHSPLKPHSPTSKSSLLLKLHQQKTHNTILSSAIASRAMALSHSEHTISTLRTQLATLTTHNTTLTNSLSELQLQHTACTRELAATQTTLSLTRDSTTALKRLLLRGSPLLKILEDQLVVDGDTATISTLKHRLAGKRDAIEFLRAAESSGWAEQMAALEHENIRLRQALDGECGGAVGELRRQRDAEREGREKLVKEFKGWVRVLGEGMRREVVVGRTGEGMCDLTVMMARRQRRVYDDDEFNRPRPEMPGLESSVSSDEVVPVLRKSSSGPAKARHRDVKKRNADRGARRTARENAIRQRETAYNDLKKWKAEYRKWKAEYRKQREPPGQPESPSTTSSASNSTGYSRAEDGGSYSDFFTGKAKVTASQSRSKALASHLRHRARWLEIKRWELEQERKKPENKDGKPVDPGPVPDEVSADEAEPQVPGPAEDLPEGDMEKYRDEKRRTMREWKAGLVTKRERREDRNEAISLKLEYEIALSQWRIENRKEIPKEQPTYPQEPVSDDEVIDPVPRIDPTETDPDEKRIQSLSAEQVQEANRWARIRNANRAARREINRRKEALVQQLEQEKKKWNEKNLGRYGDAVKAIEEELENRDMEEATLLEELAVEAAEAQDLAEDDRVKLAELALFQAAPIVPDFDHRYFIDRWDALNQRITVLATLAFGEHHDAYHIPRGEMAKYLHDDGLFAIYMRDILLNRLYLYEHYPRFLVDRRGDPNYKADDPPRMHRANLAIGLFYRILHEEIFEAMRNFFHVKIPDSRRSWMCKKQKTAAWDLTAGDPFGEPRVITPFELQGSEYTAKSVRERWAAAHRIWPKDQRGKEIRPGEHRAYLPASEVEQMRLELLRGTDRKRFHFFKDMSDKYEEEENCDGDLNAFHTTRAKMYKTLFTLQSDPMYEHTREWRARVVDLIMDTLEPLRHRRSNRSCTAPDGTTIFPQVPNSLPRRTVKATIWSIVKDAFSLAVDMNCQRDVIYTDMPRPSTEYHFDYREHREVTEDWDIPGQQIADLCQLAEGLAAPAYFSLECKVEAIIVPRLVRRGIEIPITRTHTEKVTVIQPEIVTETTPEGVEKHTVKEVTKEVDKEVTVVIGHRHQFDKERTLAKALVYAHLPNAAEDIPEWEANLVRIYREVDLVPPEIADLPADDTPFDKLQSRAARVAEFERVVREQITARREALQKKNEPEPVIEETPPSPFQDKVDELELQTKSLDAKDVADPTKVHKTAAEAMREVKKAEIERKTQRKRKKSRVILSS